MMPAQLEHAAQGVRGRWRARRRLALGLSPMPRPGLALLLFGLAMGPSGLGLLSGPLLLSLDPAVSVALAALGVFVGLDVPIRRPRENRLLAASSLLAAVTIVVVGGAIWVVQRLSLPEGPNAWLLPLLLGVCAASSSTAVGEAADARRAAAVRSGSLGDPIPIVVSMLALAWLRQGTSGDAALIVGQSTLIALTVAGGAWLLAAQTSSDGEQRVFAFGALLLLGGAAAHLSLSALFTGFVSGLFWNAMGPPVSDVLVRDMRPLQHPLLVLLLVVAGARLTFSAQIAGLVAAYVVFRLAGKLGAGWLAGRIVMRDLPRDLGFDLIAPGVVGVAIALNVFQAHPALDAAETAFTVVVLGSLVSDLLSLLDPRRELAE